MVVIEGLYGWNVGVVELYGREVMCKVLMVVKFLIMVMYV